MCLKTDILFKIEINKKKIRGPLRCLPKDAFGRGAETNFQSFANTFQDLKIHVSEMVVKNDLFFKRIKK